jgi:hypothetical protein
MKASLSFGCELGKAAGHLSWDWSLMGTESPENILEEQLSLVHSRCLPEPSFPGLGGSTRPQQPQPVSWNFPQLGQRLAQMFCTSFRPQGCVCDRAWAQAGNQHVSVCCLEKPIVCRSHAMPAWALGD